MFEHLIRIYLVGFQCGFNLPIFCFMVFANVQVVYLLVRLSCISVNFSFVNLTFNLQEKLGCAGVAQQGQSVSGKVEADLTLKNDTQNVRENSDGSNRNENTDRNTHGKSNPETKLHQLLESSTRTDAVAAR